MPESGADWPSRIVSLVTPGSACTPAAAATASTASIARSSCRTISTSSKGYPASLGWDAVGRQAVFLAFALFDGVEAVDASGGFLQVLQAAGVGKADEAGGAVRAEVHPR